jgi:hypothetical protein
VGEETVDDKNEEGWRRAKLKMLVDDACTKLGV